MSTSKPRDTKNSRTGRGADVQPGSSSQTADAVAASAPISDLARSQTPAAATAPGSPSSSGTVEGIGNSFIIEAMRSMLHEFREHVDIKFSEQEDQIRQNADGVAVLTQTVATLQEQVLKLEKRSISRARSVSRASRASSMPEEQKLARRAEKRPAFSALVPAQPQLPASEPKTEQSPVLSSALDDVAAFNGKFAALPLDLYEEGNWTFSVTDFLSAQQEVHVYRTSSESKAKWRARTFAAVAALAQHRANSAATLHATTATTASPARPIVAVEPKQFAAGSPRDSKGLASSPVVPKSFYDDLHARTTTRRAMSEQPRFGTPVPALRAQTETRSPVPPARFTNVQLANMEAAHPLDARLLKALYAFENSHLGTVPAKLNLKLDPPSYSGTNDFATLEDFLNQFYAWLEVQGLTDTKGFAQASGALGFALKDDARSWYSTERNLHVQSGTPWYLDQIVVALRQRFVFETAEADALEKFNSIVLGPGGVAELVNALERGASYLVERPTAYAMRSRFMDALPGPFARKMVSSGFTAERSSWYELLSEAMNIEAAARLSAARSARLTRIVGSTIPPTSSPEEREQFPAAVTRTPPRTTDKPGNSQNPNPVPNVGGSGPNKQYATVPARPGAIFSADTRNCYKCGETGHIGRNCPNPPSAVRANAAVVDPKDNDEADPADDVVGTRTETMASKGGPVPAPGEFKGLGYDEQDMGLDETDLDDELEYYQRVDWTKK